MNKKVIVGISGAFSGCNPHLGDSQGIIAGAEQNINKPSQQLKKDCYE